MHAVLLQHLQLATQQNWIRMTNIVVAQYVNYVTGQTIRVYSRVVRIKQVHT